MYVTYVSSILILIRQIYRVIELAQGFTDYVAVHEVFFYVFDTIPTYLASSIFVISFSVNGYPPQNAEDTFMAMYHSVEELDDRKGSDVVKTF